MFFAFVIGLAAVDFIVKRIVLACLGLGESLPVIPHVFHLTLVKNTGIAFGLLAGHPGVGLVVPAMILFFVAVFRNKIHENRFAKKVCLAMIIAGALGNLGDRIFYGSVVDYLDFRIWPVFNLADTFICLGFGGIALCTLFSSRSDL